MDFIHRLPYEIKQLILSFSYKCQNIHLTNDIKSFVSTKEILYTNYWNWHAGNSFYRHFIVNDLHVMFNFEEMFYLLIVLPLRHKVVYFLHNSLHFKSTITQINMLWGLMTCKQRLVFLEIFPRFR
jgi:hypothetical protein